MQSLNTIVQQGKVLYLGISDTPAWIVSKANQYARDHGLRQFVVYQGQWSAVNRDFERDIIPMCASGGMGLASWGALGGGEFKTRQQREDREKCNNRQQEENGYHKCGAGLRDAQSTYVFPNVGGRKIEHLKGNIDALSLELSDEEMEEIDQAAPFDIGFPMKFLGGPRGVKGTRGCSVDVCGGTV